MRQENKRLRVGARAMWILIAAVIPIALFAIPAPADHAGVGRTSRVSVASDGTPGDLQSAFVSMSGNGRFVTFWSFATNLVAGDTNGRMDVFVHDRETGATERVSVSSDGGQGSGNSAVSSLSHDGRFVTFYSSAPDLVPGDTNEQYDVFVHDRETGVTERISVATDGSEATGESTAPALSGDGRYVVFMSTASDLVPGDTNGMHDVFLRDRTAGTTIRLSVEQDGTQRNGPSFWPSISANGCCVTFASRLATDPSPGDESGATSDVFLRDLEAGTLEQISVTSDGADGDGQSEVAVLSADGRIVAFRSEAPNLVPADGNFTADVFVHDRDTGRTERVSVSTDGHEGFCCSMEPSLSADGRYVSFFSWVPDLVPRDTNARSDVFVHDRMTGVTRRVSVAAGGEEGNSTSASFDGALSADGRWVAFQSGASNLVPGDDNGAGHAYVRDVGLAVGIGDLEVSTSDGVVGVTGWSSFNGVRIMEGDDPEGDVGPGARDVGADIIGGAISYSTHDGLLLARIDLAALPGIRGMKPSEHFSTPGFSGAARITYVFEFKVAAVLYEARATRQTWAQAPLFELYRCPTDCERVAKLQGSIGTTGEHVRISVPARLVDSEGEMRLLAPKMYAAIGDTAPLPPPAFDILYMDDVDVAAPETAVAIAAAGTPKEDVRDWVPVAMSDHGAFWHQLDPSNLHPGEYDIWARACLGQQCGWEHSTITLPPSSDGSNSTTPIPIPTPTHGERGTYSATPNDPLFGAVSGDPLENLFLRQQWGPKKILAPEAWQEERATGFGIRVAVLDSGVDLQHEDLQCPGKIAVTSQSDVVANDSDPDDENGHGTHVAGIIGACTNNGVGIAGVAPDTTIVPIRLIGADGSGTDAQLIAGINRATAAGAHVINMSLGYPPGKQIINDVSGIDAAIEGATDSGVVLVASAGNQAAPLCAYPSLAEDIVCVGAIDPRDAKSWYSNFPVKTDPDDVIGPGVVAPGGTGQLFCDVHSEEILSTYPEEFDNCDEGASGYRVLNGTSMASPHVAGVAALVYDRVGGTRSPDNAQTVVDAILSSAEDLGLPGYDPVFGEGRVNALAAVQSIPVKPEPTPTESPTTDPTESPTTHPTESPTTGPTESPTTDPSESPTTDPSSTPTDDPSESPTTDPSESPTTDPSESPTTDPGPTVPEAPSNLTARVASSSRIELAWADNSNSETGFTIERSLDGSNWSEIATAGRNATMHLDMGLNADTSYFYRVRALNPSGYSAYSNTASATTMGDQSGGGGSQQAPEAPTNVAATSSSPSRIEVSWADKSNNEDGFALERSRDAGSTWQEIATTGRNQTNYLDTGLSADTSYSYRVRAYNSAGHSAYSSVASAKTAPAAGGEPSPDPSESSQPVEPLAVGSATTSNAASRQLIAFKKGVELSGVVERDDNCTGPLEIEVSRRIHGNNAYEALDSTPVNGAGAWGLQVVGQRNASYVAQVKETDTCQGDASAPTDVLVKAKISARVPAICRGTVRGKVAPRYEGSEVVLQRRGRGGWKTVATDILDADSRFSLRARKCGLHRVMWNEEGAANEPAKKRFRL